MLGEILSAWMIIGIIYAWSMIRSFIGLHGLTVNYGAIIISFLLMVLLGPILLVMTLVNAVVNKINK